MSQPNDYLLLFADCVPVKGASKSVIMDVGRRDLYEIGNDYFELIEQFENEKYANVIAGFSDEELTDSVVPFVDFLLENELAHFHADKDSFPKIQFQWDDYSLIGNAIIDIGKQEHDLKKIIGELDSLGTKYLQFRFYRQIDLPELEMLVDLVSESELLSIEIVAQYNDTISEKAVEDFLRAHPIITMLTFSGSPENKMFKVFIDPDLDEKIVISKLLFINQEIKSCDSCGIINMRNMVIPQMKEFSEAKNYNSCLNRKIAIDTNGFIRNCPSMKTHFGHHKEMNLFDALQMNGFKDVWEINKDKIKVCKSCEYRYICTDCRAFVEEPENLFSKPLKCNYDPFEGVWNSVEKKSGTLEKEYIQPRIFGNEIE